jgi:hypothetical protein
MPVYQTGNVVFLTLDRALAPSYLAAEGTYFFTALNPS